jgi:hypothetical protein|tara:strand:- start:61 stop:267 length:207 start_codon:yes stop_codon:yes gene_type:complete
MYKLARRKNMYNLTNRAKQHFLNFFKSEDDKEQELIDFLKAEYKKDWKAAYAWYLEEGTLPNYVRRSL